MRDDAPMRIACAQARGSLHPEGVLAPQLRQIARVRLGRVLRRQQPHHLEEERRLRAAQVVAARAVGDVAVGVDQVREIADHVLDQILPAAFLQSEHREVRIPVVDLAKPAAGNHVRPRQRQQR